MLTMTLTTEDMIFFVFDNDRVKDESEFVEDGILYFSPNSVEKTQQCGLVGQLIGINRFLKTTFGSSASIYCLQDAKVAFRHIEHYTLGLSGKLYCSNSLLLELLDQFIDIFRFYQGSFEVLQKICESQSKDFREELQKTWDCLTAFIKRYGDTTSSDFQSVPYVKVPKEIELEVYLQSVHLLQEALDMVPGVSAGCLLYNNQVCCSQMSLAMTSRFIVIRPKQQNLPCQQLSTDLELQGVRIFKVYLSSAEVESLKALNPLPPFSSLKLKKNLSPSAEHCHHSDEQMNSSKTTAKHSTSNGLASPDSTSFAAGSRPQHSNESSSETDGSSSSSSSCEQILVKNCELGKDVAIHPPTDSDLCEMEMFVQGSSDSVCVLLMEKGSLSDVTALKKIWKHILMGMSEIEALIRGTAKESRRSEHRGSSDFRYLTFNSLTGSLNGDLLRPMTSSEHSFCQSAQMMHTEFKASADVREITLRTHQSVFAGIQDGYDEFFIWMKGFSMRPGLPSSKADLDSKQLISKLKKTKTCSF